MSLLESTIMSKPSVTLDDSGWKGALRDAEEALRIARNEVSKWESTVRICRQRVQEEAVFPKVSIT